MAYQNQTQTQFEKSSIQSNSYAFFSNDSMLRMSFTDSMLSLSIRNVSIDENGKRKYPRVQGEKSAVLTVSRAVILLRRLKEGFVPKLTEYINAFAEDPSFDKMTSVGVILNKDSTSVLSITTGRPDIKKGYCPTLQICTNLAADTRIPETVKSFTFSETIPVVTGYDPVTGNFETCEDEAPQLIMFISVLEHFVAASTGAYAHSVNMELRDKINTIDNIVSQIAASNGIVVPSKNYSSGGSRNIFNQSASNGITEDTAPDLKPYDENLAEFGEGAPF